MINLLGFIATCTSFILWLPQAHAVWKVRSSPVALAVISPATQYFVLASALLWGIYAALTASFWVGAPGLINTPLAIMTLVLLYRARKTTQNSPTPELAQDPQAVVALAG